MIRPHAARWFELLVARDDTTLALEALAATGAVELEMRHAATAEPGSTAPWEPELQRLVQRFDSLAQRYQAWWPGDGLLASSVPEPPLQAMQRCVAQLESWAGDAEPLIRHLQEARSEAQEVSRWQRVIEHLLAREPSMRGAAAALSLGQLAAVAAPLQVRLAVVPVTDQPARTETGPDGPVVLSFDAEGWRYDLALGSAPQLLALSQLTAAAKGHWHAPPVWLQDDLGASLAAAQARLTELGAAARRLDDQLGALADAHQLRRVLADARRLHWVADNVQGLEAGEWLTWITGWTSESPAALEAAIEAAGARALLRSAAPPGQAAPPMLLANPPWARPFEVFARALGMPSGTEADPSVLLALAVPLMFGYMFGDIGQGLVIAAAGFLLRKRFALARLFMAGGLASVFFGWVFGSIFSLHVLQPLWIQPLEDPLAVLVAPLFGGAVLLTIGLGLSALAAHWRGELGTWLATDAGYLLCYLSLMTAILWPPALVFAAAGALLYCLGHAVHERRAAAALTALGELVERLLQILINTLSFARVGAFALAHAGLSSAIAALAAAAPNLLVATLVVVLGNAIVILLEGLVVSIQTTRLVLFEFFARFLSGQGRVFRPLPLPPSTASRGRWNPLARQP